MVEIEYVKKHLRIENDAEDELLQKYILAAEEVVTKFLNLQEHEIHEAYGAVPAAIKNGICMLVGSLYQNREATSNIDIRINPMAMVMLRPFKHIRKYVD